MRRDLIASQNCSIARTTAIVGDPWSLLIVREALGGATRFQDFQDGTGAQPSVISDRLKRLVGDGVLERFHYSEHPPRLGYQLTEKGNALLPLITAMIKWGDTYLDGGAGPPITYRHTTCGGEADPTMVCGHCGDPLEVGQLREEPGPGTRP